MKAEIKAQMLCFLPKYLSLSTDFSIPVSQHFTIKKYLAFHKAKIVLYCHIL